MFLWMLWPMKPNKPVIGPWQETFWAYGELLFIAGMFAYADSSNSAMAGYLFRGSLQVACVYLIEKMLPRSYGFGSIED